MADDFSGGAPAPADTSSHSAPIDPAPVTVPKPIESNGVEAPPKPPAPAKPKSAEESVHAAMEKVKARAETKEPAPKPATNAPPEKAAPAPAKATPEAKSAPEAEPKSEAAVRAPDGKFAPREPAQGEAAQPTAQSVAKPASPPPPRYAPDAQAEWEKTPEPVRREIAKREAEMEEGVRQYREVLEPIKPYMDLAKQHNTTVHEAMERYTNLERTLVSDPMRGLAAVAEYAGIDLRQMAQHILQQTPEQMQQATQVNQFKNENETLRRQLEQVQQRQQHFEQQQAEQTALSTVEQFAKDHPRLDEPEIAAIVADKIKSGYTLEDAYLVADRIRPASATSQPIRPAPAQDDQTVAARKTSIAGAPSSGSSQSRAAPSKSAEEAFRKAFRGLPI